MEQLVKTQLGELSFEVIRLSAIVNAQADRIVELEAQVAAKPEPAPE